MHHMLKCAHVQKEILSLSNTNISRQSSGHVSCTRVNWPQERHNPAQHNTEPSLQKDAGRHAQYKTLPYNETPLNTKTSPRITAILAA